MNTKEYIESGILEAYLLDTLSEEEREQVATNIALYPELAKELQEIENTMFRYAESFAVTPPPALQDKIWNEISNNAVNAGKAADSAPKVNKTIPLQPQYRKPAIDWRYAAMIAILIGSLALNYILWNQGRQDKQETTALNEQMGKLQADQQQLASLLSDYRSAKVMMADTGVQTIVMHTMQSGHPMAATLYWSKGSGDAYVAMDALPMPPKGMQYQLWVIQKGKPVSMGTLPNDMANTPVMQKIAMQVTTGEAFAISLEKQGGNPTPTNVYVLGKA